MSEPMTHDRGCFSGGAATMLVAVQPGILGDRAHSAEVSRSPVQSRAASSRRQGRVAESASAEGSRPGWKSGPGQALDLRLHQLANVSFVTSARGRAAGVSRTHIRFAAFILSWDPACAEIRCDSGAGDRPADQADGAPMVGKFEIQFLDLGIGAVCLAFG